MGWSSSGQKMAEEWRAGGADDRIESCGNVHTYSTMLAELGNDVKVVQGLEHFVLRCRVELARLRGMSSDGATVFG